MSSCLFFYLFLIYFIYIIYIFNFSQEKTKRPGKCSGKSAQGLLQTRQIWI